MGIREIQIQNFRSFGDCTVRLGRFTVLVGPNASGKSNFVQALRFLESIVSLGLENAISLQGGLRYLANASIGGKRPIRFRIVSDPPYPYVDQHPKRPIAYRETDNEYTFGIMPSSDPPQVGFEIVEERLVRRGVLQSLSAPGVPPNANSPTVGQAEFVVERQGGEYKTTFKHPGVKWIRGNAFRNLDNTAFCARRYSPAPDSLLVESKLVAFFGMAPYDTLSAIDVYDFDPKELKRTQPVTGRAELEGDGRNLATVVARLLRSQEDRSSLTNMVNSMLPFVKRLSTGRFANATTVRLTESYDSGPLVLPSFLLSDGTVNLTALVIALYFQKSSLKVVEEPERNLHPSLLARVVDCMREVSATTQIVATTHNPLVLRSAAPDEVLLATRDSSGFTEIARPIDKHEVKVFLSEEMGLDELYVENLL